MKNINLKQQGFTIIEVMIVLVIAAVILLIVFLAVPALQRNSRNTQRSNDASRLAAQVNECLTNRNGVEDSCDTPAEVNFNADEMGQLKDDPAVSETGTAPGFGVAQAGIWYGRSCTASGDDTAASSTARAVVVMFKLEPDVTRCIAV